MDHDRPSFESVSDLRISRLLVGRRRSVLGLAVVAAVSGAVGIAPPLMLRRVIDDAIPSHNFGHLVLWCSALLVAAVTVEALNVLQDAVSVRMSQAVMRDVRMRVFRHLQRVPLSFYARTPAGEITNRAVNDVDNIGGILGSVVATTVGGLSMLASTLAAAFALDARLALVAIASLPFILLPLRLTTRWLFNAKMRTRRIRDAFNAIAHQALSLDGTLLMRLFGSKDRELAKLGDAGDTVAASEVRFAVTARMISASPVAIATGGQVVLWIVGGVLVMRGATTTGSLVAMGLLLSRLFLPTVQLLNVQGLIASTGAIFARIREYLELPVESGGVEPFPPDNFDIVFEHVAFGYDPARRVLNDLSLVVRQGAFIGIVGPSGSGKSTLARMLVRVDDPDGGHVLIGGHDIRAMDLEKLRAGVALVTQDVFLTHASLYENITCGRPSASQDEVWAAVKASCLDRFVATLPEGLDTSVGEHGHRFSGGERQRIALARALLSDAPILVLDEATSALDRETEARVLANLMLIRERRTMIAITHRVEALRGADAVYVFDGGRLRAAAELEPPTVHAGTAR